MNALPPEQGRLLAELAGRQHGVVARSQLREIGIAGATVARWIRVGRLHRLHAGVYAVGHRCVSREGLYLGAVLACGPGAVLSHGSAARLHRIDRRPGVGALHVSIPRGRRRSPVGVRVHRPGGLQHPDLTERHRVPVTSPARTLFDLAEMLSPRQLREAFERSEYLELLDRTRLATLLDGASGRRGLGTLRDLLGECPLPLAETRSGLERAVLSLCRQRGLPIPATNVPVLGWEVDFLWERARLVVEADGPHHRGAQRARDNRRDLELGRAGLLVRRYSDEALRDLDAVGDELEALLRERL